MVNSITMKSGEVNAGLLELILTAPGFPTEMVNNLLVPPCADLTHLDALTGLTGLVWLNISGLDNLVNVDDLGALANLKQLTLSRCKKLENIDALANLTALVDVDLYVVCHPR